MNFRVELVWKEGQDETAPSIFLTADGQVILQGRAVTAEERRRLALPEDTALISVDRRLIRAIKDML